jgi:hypothetical protein
VGRAVQTAVEPLGVFYCAEDYHQKYSLRHRADLLDEFRARGYDDRQLVDSTVAARLNGYLAGEGVPTDEDLVALGLSASARGRLAGLVSRARRGGR